MASAGSSRLSVSKSRESSIAMESIDGASFVLSGKVDGQIVRTALASLGVVFDSVEIWHTNPSDLMLLAGNRPIIEFGFARSLGRKGQFQIQDLIELVRAREENRPMGLAPDSLDWDRVEDLRSARATSVAHALLIPEATGEQAARVRARYHFVEGDLSQARAAWRTQSALPTAAMDRLTLALEGYRVDPSPYPPTMRRLLMLASEMVRSNPALGPTIFSSLAEPFVLDQFSELRRANLFELALATNSNELCLAALDEYEPGIPWDELFLTTAPLPLDAGLQPE